MTGFYDFEVFKYDWLAVFINEKDERLIVWNDPAILKQILEKFDCIVGFNNYNYDDLILTAIMNKYNNYEVWKLSNAIVTGGNIPSNVRTTARKLPTLDVKQELPPNLSLKEIEANLGMDIVETPVSFNLDRELTGEELETVIKYCIHDVETTKKVFSLRKDYFESKFDICKEFKLDKLDVRKTRASLASKVLKCDKSRLPEGVLENKDRLNIKFADELRVENIPNEILNFYKNIRQRFLDGENFEILEKEKLVCSLAGVEHTFGFGGIHGVRKNYMYEGKMLNVDVGSYYPSMIINFNFMSRASEHPDLYKNLYDTRMEYKEKKDNKQQIYKILLNGTFGALKSEFNDLFDPVMSNNICVNGQLILTDLIMSLRGYCELIQSNTDGILIKYKEKDLDIIKEKCAEWELNYNLKLDYEYVAKIVQRDVNNYIWETEDGKIKGKGLFEKYDGGDFEKNNLTVIPMALKEYYINNKNIRETITEMIEKNNVIPIQQIAKMGGTYGLMEHNGQEVQKVNRIFATWNNNYGAINKVKNNNGVKKYTKIANSTNKCYINNDVIEKTDTKLIDVDYYVKLVEKNKFIDENYKLF
jgi:phage DNA polymerase|nr:MAG TPA: DNA polymerase [Caudoviricetes sp.]